MKRVLFLNGIDRKTNCGYYTQTFFVGDLSSKFSSKTARRFLCYGTTVPKQTHYFNNQVIAPTSTYEYDALYRLTKATGREQSNLAMPNHNDFVTDIHCPDNASNAMQNYTQLFEYDGLGNMLQMKSQNAWTRDFVYNSANNRLLKHDIQQNFDDYTYDAHGNMLTMPHLSSMQWSCKDELIGAGNGTFDSYYNYDVQGNRTRKVVVKNNVVETRYYINGFEVFRKETNNTLDFERTTLNIADDEKVFVRVETETSQSPIIRYQYDNHLGSACLELDELGQIISYEEYHAFGTTSYKSGRSEIEVSLKRYKYNGKERDEETGLYAYGMRYYAAWLCRFVSVDPLQFEQQDKQPYHYCSNNPINKIDPTGMKTEDPPPDAPVDLKNFEPNPENPGYELGNITEGVYGVPEVTVEENRVETPDATANEEQKTSWVDGVITTIVGGFKSVGDFIENKFPQIFVKIFPPTALVDAITTIRTGVDINANKQEGIYDRYVSPIITIVTSIFSVLNVAKIITVPKTVKNTVKGIEGMNTGVTGVREVQNQFSEGDKNLENNENTKDTIHEKKHIEKNHPR